MSRDLEMLHAQTLQCRAEFVGLGVIAHDDSRRFFRMTIAQLPYEARHIAAFVDVVRAHQYLQILWLARLLIVGARQQCPFDAQHEVAILVVDIEQIAW